MCEKLSKVSLPEQLWAGTSKRGCHLVNRCLSCCKCCCLQMPQTRWLKTTEIYLSHGSHGLRSRSRCEQGCAPSERVWVESLLASFWRLVTVSLGLQLHGSNFCLHSHMVPSSGVLNSFMCLSYLSSMA